MGWAGGTQVAIDMIESIKMNVKSDYLKEQLYRGLIDALADQDWDCVEEALGVDPVFDDIVEEMKN